MNATNVKGVWVQNLTKDLSVIVDTNRFQIIKKKNGKPTVFQFPSEPTIGMVECMIKTIGVSEEIDGYYQEALTKFNAKRGINKNPS